MTTQPPIIITRTDLQRLEAMLERLETFSTTAEALEQELTRAQVVALSEIPAGVVTMNSRVHCREEASGKDYHLTLVFPEQAGGEGTVSVLAPVGCALLGLSVGQHIDWPAPGGKILTLNLLAVEYQPEAAGAYQR